MMAKTPEKEMFKAAKSGDLPTMHALLESNPALVHCIENDGSTPLHCAAWKGHVEAVRVLLDAGANIGAVNSNDHYGTTPLHAAAHGNQRAVAELLIARGADLSVRNLNGNTPLGETKIHSATAVAKLLRQANAPE